MTRPATNPVLKLIRRLAENQRLEGLTDQELLVRFRTTHDEAAFRGLLQRHGSMVLDVCRNVLRNEADAEDAFQATFLVLAQKAGAIRKETGIGSWLYGVAYRIARSAQTRAARRQKHEQRWSDLRPAVASADLSWRDVQQALYAELNALPECYRAPLVLCFLEGKTQDRAATLLRVCKATLKKRLDRGRALLRLRLVRRGVGPAAVLLTAATWPAATAAAQPPRLVSATVQAAMLLAAGQAAPPGLISANVVALTQGVSKAMLFTKVKIITATLLVALGLVVAALLAGRNGLPATAVAAQQVGENNARQPAEGDPGAKGGPGGGQDGAKVMKPGKWVNSLAYCNDGKTMALVIWNGGPRADTQAGSVVLWDLQKAKVEQTLEEFEKELQFWHVTASKNGATIAASATHWEKVGYGAIRVWEAKTGKVLHTFEFSAQVQDAVAISADGKKVAGGDCITPNGEVCVWDVASGNLLHKLPTPMMDNWSLALSEDGKWIAAGGWAGADGLNRKNQVMVWDLATGKVKYEWTDPNMVGAVTAVAFSPDGKLVATGGGNDATIRVWDMQTGNLKHLLKGHEIRRLVFSPDGKTLASAGMDGKIILWDVAMEKTRATILAHGKDDKGRGPFLLDVVFSSDGRTLATSGGDGTMRFWPMVQLKK
jgi:RNA polymerase sigma factor (sigma-70 family)